VWLFFKVFFIQKYIKIIFFLFFKKLFLISAYQNNLKTPEKNNLKEKNKKISNYFKNAFEA
jgi:hypothetical protein